MHDDDSAGDSKLDKRPSRPALLASAMRTLWNGRDRTSTAELFALASDAFDERARQYLAREYGLGFDQVDDCIGDALEVLFKKWNGAATDVVEPYAYLWGTVKRRALVMQRLLSVNRAGPLEQDEVRPSGYEELVSIESDVATIWFEELTEQDTLPEDRDWIQEVLAVAITRLPLALRRVAEFMLLPEFSHQETSAQEACAELGMSASAFRQNKHRALERLRKTIPGVVEELGVELRPRDAESIFVDRPSLGQDG
ncbi:sigma-70 family RNA polymerase sigma factor [Thermomonas fusca]|uniref:Sigma-70 family RNA polymerase sigma factor n=1 Tax=Thermomonas fusca TaxID=215690 RepID=A0A5R9PIQ1_9GAMM|nr:sigma-70 family RNA polymerase sigma factor [Thermomonas fusca]TLX22480.1 sigma-70 family RNA polymerase sigma factor [Thermomonas fusca]